MNYLHSLIIAVLGIAAIGVVGLAQEADAQVTGDIHQASVTLNTDSISVDFADVSGANEYVCIIWTESVRDKTTSTTSTSICEFDGLTAETAYNFNIRAKPGGYIYQGAQTLTTLASDGTNSNLLDVVPTTTRDVHGGQTTVGADFIQVDIPDQANADRYRCLLWEGEDRSAFTSRDSECRFSGLTADTEYSYNIRVIGDDGRINYYTPNRTLSTTSSASSTTDPNTYPDSVTTSSTLPTTLGADATITRSTDTITVDFPDVMNNDRAYKCFITDDSGRELVKTHASLCIFEGLESGTDYDINIRYKATGNSGHVFDGAQTITTP